jgi:hypothetical protein
MTCAECTTTGRRGYCAPLRCYCGHDTCHAFASWQPRAVPLANVQTLPVRASSAWADREESTWIDKL